MPRAFSALVSDGAAAEKQAAEPAATSASASASADPQKENLQRFFEEVDAVLKLDAATAHDSELRFYRIAALNVVEGTVFSDRRNFLRRCVATAIFITSVNAEHLEKEGRARALSAEGGTAQGQGQQHRGGLSGGALLKPATAAAVAMQGGGPRLQGNGVRLNQLLSLSKPVWLLNDFVEYVRVVVSKLGDSALAARLFPALEVFQADFLNIKSLRDKFDATWEAATRPLPKLHRSNSKLRDTVWVLLLLAKDPVTHHALRMGNELLVAYIVQVLCTDWVLATAGDLGKQPAWDAAFRRELDAADISGSSSQASARSDGTEPYVKILNEERLVRLFEFLHAPVDRVVLRTVRDAFVSFLEGMRLELLAKPGQARSPPPGSHARTAVLRDLVQLTSLCVF